MQSSAHHSSPPNRYNKKVYILYSIYSRVCLVYLANYVLNKYFFCCAVTRHHIPARSCVSLV